MNQQHYIKKYDQRELIPQRYTDYPFSPVGDETHLRDYLNVVLKRKYMVLLFLFSAVAIAALFSLMSTPLYRSTSVIRIDKEAPQVLSFDGIQIDSGNADYYQTQFEILKSRNLAERVIRRLGLDKDDNFLPPRNILQSVGRFLKNNVIGPFANFFKSLTSPGDSNQAGTAAASEIPDYLTSSLISRIQVEPVKNSQLVNVSFTSHDPELSMNVANAIGETYIAFELESRIYAGKEARQFLEGQIEMIKRKVEESETKLNAYASREEIIYTADKESIWTRKLSDISAALTSITAEKLQKEALFREVKQAGGNNPIVLNNPLIMELKKDVSALEAEYHNLLKTYTPQYPKMQNLKSQIGALQNRISQESSKIVSSVKSDYHAAVKKEENLTKAFDAQKEKVLSFQDAGAQYEVLKREVDVNKGLYNTLLQRLNEVSVSASNKATNIQILDRAIFPKSPFAPNIFFNILLSLLFGSVGGVGLAFLAEYFDNSIKDTNDIETKANLPILGVIPSMEGCRELASLHARDTAVGKEEQARLPMVIDTQPANRVIEAFRSIGAFIQLSASPKPPKIMLVTGPGERVGKTSICVNITKALLESVGRGIVIDADLRRPKLHSVFRLDNSTGLSSFLSGNIDFDPADGRLIKETGISGLSAITSGPIPPNPSELLASSRMQELIYALQPLCDFIVLDSPPIMGLPDAIYLSKIVDGSVLVVKAGETPLKVLKEAKRVFRDIDAKILGVVLNGAKKTDLKYGCYHFYHSSYYSSYFDKESESTQ